MNWRLIASMVVAVGLFTGCGHTYDVEFDVISKARSGQVVDPGGIELVEGQAIGIEVIAIQDEREREGWTVRASSDSPSVVDISETLEPNIFVVQGIAAGEAEIEFVLQGRHDVFVPVEVVVRPEWESQTPSQSPQEGLGGQGGSQN